MKQLILALRIIAAFVLITFGVNNLSEPSNFKVGMGLLEILLGLIILYRPVISLFKKI